MNEVKSVSLIIPDKYGISTENSNVIAKNCIPIIQEFNNLEIEFDLIMGEKEMTADIAKHSKALRNKYVKVRTGGVKVIQASKEDAKKQVDAHDQLNRDFKDEITSREDQLREKEYHFEKIEAKKLAKIRQARTIELDKYETFYGAGDIALLDDVLYGHFLNGVKADFEAKKAEEKRIEAEQIEQQKKLNLFNSRQEKLVKCNLLNVFDLLTTETTEKEFIKIVEKGELLKIEFEAEQKRIKAENERLKKEAEAKRIVDEKAEKQRQAKADKERAAHEAELKKEREEKARIQKELEAKAEAERKRKRAEQIAIIKAEEEKKAEAEQNRLLELAPVKDKLKLWINNLEISDPTNKDMDKETFEMVEDIMVKFNKFKIWAKGEIEKVK